MRKMLAFIIAVATVAALASVPAHADQTTYFVGAAKRSINPGADGTFAGQPVYLGGFGFGSGGVWDAADLSRPPASGILGPGVHARAFIVAADDDPTHALVLAQIETQGYFVAYQQGPYGLEDMRKAVQARVGIPAERVIIGGNHSHAGPDTMGVWGGVATEYLAYIFEQTVGAIADAWSARRTASVWYGSADGSDLQANQFGHDPANETMDSELRVLQARDASTGEVFATMINASIHPTVMGGGNTLVSADWPGPAGELLGALGGEGIAIVGTLGRTQPNRGPSFAACSQNQYCALDHFAGRVVDRAKAAIASAEPLTGSPVVDGHSYLITDVAHNGLLLAASSPVGAALGVPIKRSILAPWTTGNVVGTLTFSARIGDLLLSGGPGELYPQIPIAVRQATAGAGVRGMLVFGLAGDQLGYILAPFPEAYPEPMRTSMFDGDRNDPTSWGFSPIDNDNYFFNVSHTLGERVICSMLRGAGAVFGDDESAFWKARAQCAAFVNDFIVPAGADTLAPSTP